MSAFMTGQIRLNYPEDIEQLTQIALNEVSIVRDAELFIAYFLMVTPCIRNWAWRLPPGLINVLFYGLKQARNFPLKVRSARFIIIP